MTDTKSTLLFIPDISGFTDFVNTTEIDHSSHIIAELLEIIINSDKLGMRVSEIEGDAVLCFKDAVPTIEELVEQCIITFKNFHSHLQRYDTERICRCGACETASQLSLKFVIHAGDVKKIKVKDIESLHGSDVILAHRLLKNSIPDSEYILFTNSIAEAQTEPIKVDGKAMELLEGKDTVDKLGELAYSYFSLKNLHDELPVSPPVTFPELSPQKIVIKSDIKAPIDLVYENYTNFDRRLEWNEDIKEIVMKDKGLNKTGSLHTCLVGPYSFDVESIGMMEDRDKIVYGERLNSFKGLRDIITIFTFEKQGDQTSINVEVDFKIKSLVGRLMKSMVRKMLQKNTEDGLKKLKQVSEENAD